MPTFAPKINHHVHTTCSSSTHSVYSAANVFECRACSGLPKPYNMTGILPLLHSVFSYTKFLLPIGAWVIAAFEQSTSKCHFHCHLHNDEFDNRAVKFTIPKGKFEKRSTYRILEKGLKVGQANVQGMGEVSSMMRRRIGSQQCRLHSGQQTSVRHHRDRNVGKTRSLRMACNVLPRRLQSELQCEQFLMRRDTGRAVTEAQHGGHWSSKLAIPSTNLGFWAIAVHVERLYAHWIDEH